MDSTVNNGRTFPQLKAPAWRFITPKMAQGCISEITENRKPKKSVVKEYVRLMNAGLWTYSPHGITIGSDGKVVDGNHRMIALSMSSVKGIWFLVCHWDIGSRELRVDRGTGRTLSDFADCERKSAQACVAIATLLSLGRSSRMDPTEMLPATNSFSGYADMLFKSCNTCARGRSSNPVIVGCIAACLLYTSDAADE